MATYVGAIDENLERPIFSESQWNSMADQYAIKEFITTRLDQNEKYKTLFKDIYKYFNKYSQYTYEWYVPMEAFRHELDKWVPVTKKEGAIWYHCNIIYKK